MGEREAAEVDSAIIRIAENEQDRRLMLIRNRRAQHVGQDQIGDDVRESIEGSERNLDEIDTRIRTIYDKIKPFLPPHSRFTDESGVDQTRPATWQDIQTWSANGQLNKYLLTAEKNAAPAEPNRRLLQRAQAKIDDIALAQSLIGERTKLVVSPDVNVPFDQKLTGLNDDQKIAHAFRFFRLRELVESRIERQKLTEQIEVLNQDIAWALEDARLGDVDEFSQKLVLVRQQLRESIEQSPEAYYDYWAKELLVAQRALNEFGTIYESPTVVRTIEKIMRMLAEGSPVFIHGETGSGKTEIAKYIAKSRFGKDALIVSGRRELEISEITESQTIQVKPAELPEITRQKITQHILGILADQNFQTTLQQWATTIGKSLEVVRQEEIAKLEASYTEYYRRPMEVKSRLQPYYQAAQEGRIIIIDEMNAVPHHTLIALNDLLNRRPLDQVTYERYQKGEITAADIDARHKFRPLYSDEEIVIAPGFGIIATGNWKPEDGAHYAGRQTLDSAFMRRFGILHHDYLPNSELALEEPDIDRDEELRRKKESELFRMISAQLLEPNLTAELPVNAFDQLEQLAKVARLIQDAFSGSQLKDEFQPTVLTGTGGKLKATDVIKENVLDLGKIIQFVLIPWKQDGYRKPLDYYIFDRYVSRSSARPTELVYLYKLFQLHGFFADQALWPDLIDVVTGAGASSASGLAASNEERIRALSNLSKNLDENYAKQSYLAPKRKFFSLQAIIDRLIGRRPERRRYPNFTKLLQPTASSIPDIEIDPVEIQLRNDIRSAAQGVFNSISQQIAQARESSADQLFLNLSNDLQNAGVSSTDSTYGLLARRVIIQTAATELRDASDTGDLDELKLQYTALDQLVKGIESSN